MKLLALKRFSSRVPKGATFELPDRDARVVIAAGAAVAADDEVEPRRRERRSYRRRDLRAES